MRLPASGDQNRTTRIAVMARRSDIDTMPTEHVTDSTLVTVSYSLDFW